MLKDYEHIRPVVFNRIRQAAHTDDAGMVLLLKEYIRQYERLGAPRPIELTLDDAVIVASIGEWRPEFASTWDEFRTKIRVRKQAELERLNPYMPIWFEKTEGRPNPWTWEAEPLPVERRGRLNTLLSLARPEAAQTRGEMFSIPPTYDAEFLDEIITAIIRNRTIFLWGGADATDKVDPRYRWGSALVPFAGLGLPALRRIARSMDEDPDWQAWAHASNDDLIDDVIESRAVTGYPASLYRLNFRSVYNVMRSTSMLRPDGTRCEPRWFTALAALHILKHCRFWPDYNGQPYISVMFEGSRYFRPLDPTLVSSSLSSSGLRPATADICGMLGIPYQTGRMQREWYDDAVWQALNKIQIENLPRPRDIRSRVYYIVPEAVGTEIPYRSRQEYSWVSPGINITNVSGFDTVTGKVEQDITVDPHDVIALRWPFQVDRPEDTLKFKSMLPETVLPEPASSVITRSIRNVAPLGNDIGLRALIDTIITADLLRLDLLGTQVGNILGIEFPLVFALPTGFQPETTTNQGKTNFCRVFASILVPGITVHVFHPNASAPAQRSMSMPIEKHGTGIIDEYQLPRTHDHFLAQAGLQALATGGLVHPGRAQENCPGLRLQHPLFFTAKFSPRVPDIANRMLPIFLEALTPETMATEQELANIMSGQIGLKARLQHLYWMQRNNLYQRLRDTTLATGEWRFNAHLAVAGVIAQLHGGSLDDVNAYIKAAKAMCQEQLRKADASGLTEEVAGVLHFDPKWYWEQATQITIESIKMMCQPRGTMRASDALRLIIEDTERRQFSRTIGQCNITESSAAQRFSRQLRDTGPWEREDGWILELVKLDNKRAAHIKLRHTKDVHASHS